MAQANAAAVATDKYTESLLALEAAQRKYNSTIRAAGKALSAPVGIPVQAAAGEGLTVVGPGQEASAVAAAKASAANSLIVAASGGDVAATEAATAAASRQVGVAEALAQAQTGRASAITAAAGAEAKALGPTEAAVATGTKQVSVFEALTGAQNARVAASAAATGAESKVAGALAKTEAAAKSQTAAVASAGGVLKGLGQTAEEEASKHATLTQTLVASGRAIDAQYGRIGYAGATIARSTIPIAAATVAILAFGAGLIATAAAALSFQRGMADVNSILQVSDAQLSALSGQVLGVLRDLPVSAKGLTEALYQIASAGFQGSDAINVLNASATLGTAGLTDADKAASALTTVLDAYGLSANEAGHVSDVLITTVQVGKFHFDALASGIGNVVGVAAAAKIPIDEVGAAIAAASRAGLPADQAFTALNRLIISLINPNKALAATFKELGINITSELANPAIGLAGVMKQIGDATGYDVTKMLELFPNIRAGKEAFALLAQGGALYADVASTIGNSNDVAGATQRALNEQMKSLSNQFKVVRNEAEAWAVSIGLKVLPALSVGLADVVKGVKSFSTDAGSALRATQPFFEGAATAVGNIAGASEKAYSAFAPFVKVIASLAGTATVFALNTIGTALSGVTGILEKHPVIVEAAALAYTAHLVPALAVTAAWAARGFFLTLASQAVGAAWAIRGAAISLAGSLTGVQLALAGLGAGIALVGVTYIIGAFSRADAAAKSFMATLDQKLSNKTDFASLESDLTTLRAAQDKVGASAGGLQSTWAGFEHPIKALSGSLGAQRKEWLDTSNAVSAQNDKIKDYIANVTQIARTTGLSFSQVSAHADAMGVDMTKAFGDSVAARQQVIDDLSRTAGALGLNISQLQSFQTATGVDIAGIQQLADEVTKYQKTVSDAFDKSNDLVQGLGKAASPDQLLAAQDAVVQAQDAVNKASASGSTNSSKAVIDANAERLAREKLAAATAQYGAQSLQAQSASLSLQRAHATAVTVTTTAAGATDSYSVAVNKLKIAQDKLATAQGPTADSIRKFYADALATSTKFSSDIQAVIQKGLDPKLVSDLMAAGPKDAEPILAAILSDTTGTLIAQVNAAQSALATLNAGVLEQAKVVAEATSTTASAAKTSDAPLASAIVQQQIAQGPGASSVSIATALKTSAAEVERVSAEYALGVPTTSTPVPRPGGNKAFAEGGIHEAHIATTPEVIFGEPETGGEAYIPLGADKRRRSLALTAQVAARFGYELVPSGTAYMADGGIVRPPGASLGASGGPQVIVIRQVVPQSTQNRYEFSGPIQGVQMADVLSFAAAKKRQNALTPLGVG